jgi:hypothetical protein
VRGKEIGNKPTDAGRLATDWRRIPPHESMRLWTPNARCWQRDLDADFHLNCIITRDIDDLQTWPKGRWHMSISHRTNGPNTQPGRLPTWDEIHEARYRFVPDAALMVLFLPPKDNYVNLHTTTMQLLEIKGQ